MATRQRLDGGSAWSDFTKLAIAACAIMLGFAVAHRFGSISAIVKAADEFRQQFAGRRVEPPAWPALVVTANRGDQLTAVATLSPRGFAPLLGASRREVLSQIRSHPGGLKLAVVDARLPDFPVIVRALQGVLPGGSIIVLKSPHRPQDVGPLLLDRLGIFEKLNPRARIAPRRPPPYARVETVTVAD